MEEIESSSQVSPPEILPFGSLPAEILVKIFKQVDFAVLIALSEDQHLKNFTFVRQVIQRLDFCSAKPLDGPKVLKFISLCNRTSHVEGICLNNVGGLNCRLNRIFLSIPRWKCLKTLHVSHCGLDVNQVFDILKELNQIEEFSWSLFKDDNDQTTVPLFRPSSSKRSKMLYNGGFNVKVLNLDLLCSHIQLLGLLDFLRQFPKIETLRIHIYHFNFLTFASAIPYSSYNEAAVEFPLLTSFFLTSDNHDTRETADTTLTSRCRCISSVINSVVLGNSPSATPWKEFVTVNSDNSRLEKEPKAISLNTPKTVHIQRRPLELSTIFTDWILAPGDAVENLSLFSCTFCGTNSERILPRILSKCRNIRELNMEDTEWVNFELCSELYNLKRLRKLVIPDSAWNRPPLKTNENEECINCSRPSSSKGISPSKRRRISHTSKTVQIPLLNPLVNSCQQLTELEIRHTKLLFKNQAVLSEMDYASISRLVNLRKLTIIKSEGVQNGAFLIPIAEQCVKL